MISRWSLAYLYSHRNRRYRELQVPEKGERGINWTLVVLFERWITRMIQILVFMVVVIRRALITYIEDCLRDYLQCLFVK